MPAALVLDVADYTDETRWRWRLATTDGRFLADHEVALDPRQAEYRGFVDLDGYLRFGADPADRLTGEAALCERIGRYLADQVLGPVAGAIVDHAPAVVRVRVPLAAQALAYRPLELTQVGHQPLALHDVSLVFEVGRPAEPAKAAVGRSLRVLGVFSLPLGVSALALRHERYSLGRLLHQVAKVERLAIDYAVLQYGVTRQRLREVLTEEDGWDIVHFSGHGLPEGLVLEHLDGTEDVVSSADLVELLWRGRERLKLVTLSSCFSAAATAATALREVGIAPPQEPEVDSPTGELVPALAQRVVERLGCAVVAMRYPVVDDFAVDLAAGLYRRLVGQGQPLPQALQLALAESVRVPPRPGAPALSVATPALFGSRAAGLSLRAPVVAGPVVFRRPALAGAPPEPERFVGRVGPLARASSALAPQSGASGVLFYGMAGAGKTTCAAELAYRHADSFPTIVWFRAPDEGDEIAGSLAALAVALESRIDGLGLVHLVDNATRLRPFLPELTAFFEAERILVVVDNAESLLSGTGAWRDPAWGMVVGAMAGHSGLSRLVLTSRRRPTGMDARIRVEPIHALSLSESILLARQLPSLGALIRGEAPGVSAPQARNMVRQVLDTAQGHPGLLALADGQAGDPAALSARLAEAFEAWERSDSDAAAFFATGRSAATPTDYLAHLETWTRGAAANLDDAATLLFGVLCHLEDEDRIAFVVDANWADIWHRLDRDGDPPAWADALQPLVDQGLVEVDEGDDPLRRSVRIHPAVAATGKRLAADDLGPAVDTEIGTYWRAVFDDASRTEDEQRSGDVAAAGRRAAPYLLRLGEWDLAGALLERSLQRDGSRSALGAVLPLLQRIADATTGTERGLEGAGVLAWALAKVDPDEGERRLRDTLRQAVEQGRWITAGGIASGLANLIYERGRLEDALTMVNAMARYYAEGGSGGWTLLFCDARRLQVLNDMGHNENVLAEAKSLRDRMEQLPAAAASTELVFPWAVRELIFGTARSAAHSLRRWDDALAWNAELVGSLEAREAPALSVAIARFNGAGALVGLGQTRKARSILQWCQAVFQEDDPARLGDVFSLLAVVENLDEHLLDAVAFAERALRYDYAAGRVGAVALSHGNLAAYCVIADRLDAGIAHRLAAALLRVLTGAGEAGQTLRALAADLRALGEGARVPETFASLCAEVGRVEGVDLGRLVTQLGVDAEAAESALAGILREAREVPPPLDVDGALAMWEPVIDAAVQAVGGEPEAVESLTSHLAEREQSADWATLVAVIRRIVAGERNPAAFLDGLDDYDTAIASEILRRLGSG